MAKLLGIHIPAVLKNHATNGALDFWQDKLGTTTTVNTATTTTTFYADMFKAISVGATTKNYSIVRSTDVPSLAQSGFQSVYSSLFTMITGIGSPAAGDRVTPAIYVMEGYDYEKLHTKTITFGLWVKASVAGTYSFALGNGAGDRSYVTTFTVNGGSTWEFKTITITLDQTGTWLFDNTGQLWIYIGTVAGSTYTTSSLNQWQAGFFLAASGATNWQGTNGATLQIAQFSIVEGPLGFGSKGFARKGDSIQSELSACERYLQSPGKSTDQTNTAFGSGFAATTTSSIHYIKFSVPMRAQPSLIVTPGDWALQRNGGGTVAVTAMSFNNVGLISARLGANVAAGLTAGEGLVLITGNTNGMLFDARL